jgi:hypothetical protein
VRDPNNIGNQYTFVGNNPISNIDPLGLWSLTGWLTDEDYSVSEFCTAVGRGILNWASEPFFSKKGIGQNTTMSRNPQTSHGVVDPLGETMLESTSEELAERQAIEDQSNAAFEAGVGGAGIVAGGADPAEALTGMVVGEATDSISEPTEEPGVLRQMWDALGAAWRWVVD